MTADADLDPHDPWAWLRDEEPEHPLPSGEDVTGILVSHDGARWLPDTLAALAALTVRPRRLVAVDTGADAAASGLLTAARGDGILDDIVTAPAGSFGAAVRAALAVEVEPARWLWLLHDDATPAPDALARLLARAEATPGAAAVTPVLLAPRRRGVGALIDEVGQTVTRGGAVTSAGPSGVIDQGQLEAGQVLGASTCALLVDRAAFDAVDGTNDALPGGVQGLDLGARLTASGRIVTTEPEAKVRHVAAATRGLRGPGEDAVAVERRVYGMGFDAVVHGRGGGIATTAGSWARVLGLVLAKDTPGAAIERRALAGWRASVDERAAVAERFAAAATGEVDLTPLRPTRGDAVRAAVEDLGGRLSEWAASFTDRGVGVGLDTLTGDDFAGSGLENRRRPWAPWAVTLGVLVVAAIVAGRDLFGLAPLRGPHLLPAPDTATGLLDAALAPLAGTDPGAGAPWAALAWLASLPLLTSADALVTLVLFGCVPALFLLARRLLVRATDDRTAAAAGALGVALAPVLTGAVGRGEVGAVAWVVLAVLAATGVRTWYASGLTWGGAARLALALAGLIALAPLTGLLALAGVGVLGFVRRAGLGRVLVAALAPLLVFVTPWSGAVLAHPGRLLTGIEPLLAPLTLPDWWALLLGRTGGDGLPPLWLSVGVVGVWWLLAFAGAVLRPATAGWALAVAAASGLVATAITRGGVSVPPDAVVVPQATEWVILLVAALAVAAALGFAGLAERASATAFGLRQLLTAGVGVLAAGVLLVTVGWWVAVGLAPLERADVGAVPPFIARDQQRGATRTLALRQDGDTLAWALHEGDFARLGDAERGLVFDGDPDARDLAASVVARIASGTADDALAADLARLGVGHVWVKGATPALAVGIANTPGLGTAAAEGDTLTWALPTSGRLVVRSGTDVARLDPAAGVSPGVADRTLTLAEPADPRWRASLDGAPLTAVPDAAAPTFALGAGGGTLRTWLDAGVPWWAWVQFAGLAGLVVLAAPALGGGREAERRSARGGRRAVGSATHPDDRTGGPTA